LPGEFCPNCGRRRTGSFRYCRDCRFDFESTNEAGFESIDALARAEGSARVTPPPVPLWGEDPAPVAPVSAAAARPVTPTKRSWRRYAVVGVVAFFGIGALGNLISPADRDASSATGSSTPSVNAVAPSARPTPTRLGSAMPTLAFAPTGSTEKATVTRVVDGDTIHVDIDGKDYALRYIGMDTPEPDDPDPAVKALAHAATDANANLVEGQDVILERDVSDTDQFGRLLRNVWVERDGQRVMVGLELVAEGFAQVATYPPDVQYVDLLVAAEQTAREASVGLWSPDPTPSPTAAPTPAPTPIVTADFVDIFDSHSFKGGPHVYAWTDVTYFFEAARYKVTAKAAASKGCRITWKMADGEARNGFTLKIGAGTTNSKTQTYDPAVDEGSLSVTSTCPSWTIRVSEYVAPAPKPIAGSDCHPSYEGACLKKDASDYDCAGGSGNGPYYVRGPIKVVGPDVFDLDRDGDGIACDR